MAELCGLMKYQPNRQTTEIHREATLLAEKLALGGVVEIAFAKDCSISK